MGAQSTVTFKIKNYKLFINTDSSIFNFFLVKSWYFHDYWDVIREGPFSNFMGGHIRRFAIDFSTLPHAWLWKPRFFLIQQADNTHTYFGQETNSFYFFQVVLIK